MLVIRGLPWTLVSWVRSLALLFRLLIARSRCGNTDEHQTRGFKTKRKRFAEQLEGFGVRAMLHI